MTNPVAIDNNAFFAANTRTKRKLASAQESSGSKPNKAIYLALICRAVSAYERRYAIQRVLSGVELSRIQRPSLENYSFRGDRSDVHIDIGYSIFYPTTKSPFSDVEDDKRLELFYDEKADAIYVIHEDPVYLKPGPDPIHGYRLEESNPQALNLLVQQIDRYSRPAYYAPLDLLVMGMRMSSMPVVFACLPVFLAFYSDTTCCGKAMLPLIPLLLGIAIPITAIGMGLTITSSLMLLIIDVLVVQPVSLFMRCCSPEGVDVIDRKLAQLKAQKAEVSDGQTRINDNTPLLSAT